MTVDGKQINELEKRIGKLPYDSCLHYNGVWYVKAESVIDAIKPKTTESVTRMNPENMHDRPTDDFISRKMAIDQLHQSYNLLDAENRIKALPPTDVIELGVEYSVHQYSVVVEEETEVYRTDQADFYIPKRTFKVERL